MPNFSLISLRRRPSKALEVQDRENADLDLEELLGISSLSLILSRMLFNSQYPEFVILIARSRHIILPAPDSQSNAVPHFLCHDLQCFL